ncbi:MAG: peptidoglycan-binding protein [Polyangiaceae bacterium]|jgi:hypothetical protein|nr:peptidoglycan-binding protein [Polyangiaceae bacterium]
MRPYVVRQGDYLTKLAHMMGFEADAVWNHPKNKALKEKRPDRDTLHPGDLLWLPTNPEHRRLSITAGSTNRYAAVIPKKPLEVRLQVGGEPLPKEPYAILGLGPEPILGESDEQGWIKSQVDVYVREVEIILTRKNRTLRVRVGDLDPLDTISGLKKRLMHLGYYRPGKIGGENQDAVEGEALIAALKAFQSERGLPATGKLDEETKKALRDAHGS